MLLFLSFYTVNLLPLAPINHVTLLEGEVARVVKKYCNRRGVLVFIHSQCPVETLTRPFDNFGLDKDSH